MSSSTSATGGWSDHRLRQIKTAALFVSDVLEDPYSALVSEGNGEQFLTDVGRLHEWLAPCEEWSESQQASPPSVSPAMLDALFSLRSILLRLRLPGVLSIVADEECVRRRPLS